jgi:hypothetical protein
MREVGGEAFRWGGDGRAIVLRRGIGQVGYATYACRWTTPSVRGPEQSPARLPRDAVILILSAFLCWVRSLRLGGLEARSRVHLVGMDQGCQCRGAG